MKAAGLACIMLLAAGPETPSGRPPVGPLQRVEPKIYDLRFQVEVHTVVQRKVEYQQTYDLKDAPIIMPVIYQGTFSRVEPESVKPSLWLSNHPQDVAKSMRIDGGQPFSSHVAVIPISEYKGSTLRWQVEYRVESWSSRLKDEDAALAVTWPQQWPDEVRDGLKPQMFIESGDAIFAKVVEKVSGGNVRSIGPYAATKEFLRACVQDFQVSGSANNRTEHGELQGMNLAGAKKAAHDGMGTAHDLVCVCVAVLRAAQIPARPVVGIRRDQRDRWEFVSWAEFFLPDVGWVPFDPIAMRGKGVGHRPVEEPWPEFGTMKELNERIPLAYGFIPASTVSVPENPAVWGWDPRPGGDPSSEQAVTIQVTHRGKGEDDSTPPSTRH